MSKNKNHRMRIVCPFCKKENQTRNMRPRCVHCGKPLRVIKTSARNIRDKKNHNIIVERINPRIVVAVR